MVPTQQADLRLGTKSQHFLDLRTRLWEQASSPYLPNSDIPLLSQAALIKLKCPGHFIHRRGKKEMCVGCVPNETSDLLEHTPSPCSSFVLAIFLLSSVGKNLFSLALRN